MLVSIIVPIYNGEKYLEACIKSVLEQSYAKYELILVDDGSTDSSLKICQKWESKDNRIRVHSKKNGGVSSARNVGMDISRGEYILFVDCDDLLSKEYLMKMVNVVENEGNDVLPVSNIEFIGEKDYFEVIKKNQEQVKCLTEGIIEVYDRRLFNIPWNKLYRKSIINDFNVTFREDINLGEDILFNVDYLMTKKIKSIMILEDNVYYYRTHSYGNLCNKYDSNYFNNQMEQFQAVENLFIEISADIGQSTVYRYYDDVIRWGPHYYWVKAPQHRLKRANEILKTKEYINWIKGKKNSMSKLSWHIYSSNNFFLILLFEKIYRIIHGV